MYGTVNAISIVRQITRKSRKSLFVPSRKELHMTQAVTYPPMKKVFRIQAKPQK